PNFAPTAFGTGPITNASCSRACPNTGLANSSARSLPTLKSRWWAGICWTSPQPSNFSLSNTESDQSSPQRPGVVSAHDVATTLQERDGEVGPLADSVSNAVKPQRA